MKIFLLEKHWLKTCDPNSCYLLFEFKTSKEKHTAAQYLARPKYLYLPFSNVSWRLDKTLLRIKTDGFAKSLFISIYGGSEVLPDNYFGLEAGEKKAIKIHSKIKDMKPLKIISLNNINQK